MIVKLLTEHHLEFLSLKGGCTGSSEFPHVKMPHCWKSHATAHFLIVEQQMVMVVEDFSMAAVGNQVSINSTLTQITISNQKELQGSTPM